MTHDPSLSSRIKHLHIIDPDRLELRNLSLSRLYHAAHLLQRDAILGQSKARISAQLTRDVFSSTAHPCEIADVSLHTLQNVDLFISCTDSALARLETNYAARALGVPVLDAGVLGASFAGGRVTWFSARPEAACFLCGLLEQRRAELLAFASSGSLGCSLPTDVMMGDEPFVTASLQYTAEVLLRQLKTFLTLRLDPSCPDPLSGSMTWRLAPQADEWREQTVRLRRSATCPWHEERRTSIISADPDQTFCDMLRGASGETPHRLQFLWPVCLVAVCPCCGFRDTQPRRLATVRRSSVCPNCDSAPLLEPLHTVASVGHNDPVAEMTPRQLGWTERQLFQIRPVFTPSAWGKGKL